MSRTRTPEARATSLARNEARKERTLARRTARVQKYTPRIVF